MIKVVRLVCPGPNEGLRVGNSFSYLRSFAFICGQTFFL